MKQIFNQYKYLFIGLSLTTVFVSVLAITLALTSKAIQSNSQVANNTSSSLTISSFNSSSIASSTMNEWKSYLFDRNYIKDEFTVQYPANFDVHVQDTSGTWDITLTQNDKKIELELFAVSEQGDIDNTVRMLATTSGLESFEYIYELLRAGVNNDGSPYNVYKLKKANGEEFLVAYVHVTEMSYGAPGYIGIRTNTVDLLSLVEEMLLRVG